MDPLSIIAGVIAITQVIGSSLAVVRTIRQTAEVPDQLLTLNNELVDLGLLLAELGEALKAKNLGSTNLAALQDILERTRPLVDQSRDIIEGCCRQVQRASTKAQPRRLLIGFKQRSKILHQQQKLRGIRIELSLALGTTTLSFLKSSHVLLQELTIQTSSISAKIDQSANSTASPDGTVLEPAKQGPDAEQAGQLAREAEPKLPRAGVDLEVKVSAGLKKCRENCACACHQHRRFRSPSFSDKFVGALLVGYMAALRVKGQCDRPTCEGLAETYVRMTYFFPSWFASRALQVAYRSSLAGPELLLRLPRVVDDGYTTLDLSAWGRAGALADALAAKTVAPTDVSAQSGFTGLHVSQPKLAMASSWPVS
jgi:hypothetical protein